MKVIIGADHGGYELKKQLIPILLDNGYQVVDIGTHSTESVDYPDIVKTAISHILDGDIGVLICGSGIGVSIAANRSPYIRAANVTCATMARLAREHGNANVITLGARILGFEVAKECLLTFLKTPFSNDERHIRRIAKLK